MISQFTLYGDTARGNRPSFGEAAAPELAEPLYERVCERLAAEGVGSVERGRFGAHMQVELVNDGPVTIVVELAPRLRVCHCPVSAIACYRASGPFVSAVEVQVLERWVLGPAFFVPRPGHDGRPGGH